MSIGYVHTVYHTHIYVYIYILYIHICGRPVRRPSFRLLFVETYNKFVCENVLKEDKTNSLTTQLSSLGKKSLVEERAYRISASANLVIGW